MRLLLPQKNTTLQTTHVSLPQAELSRDVNLSALSLNDFLGDVWSDSSRADVVLPLRNRLKMIWANARSYSTEMVNTKTVRYRPVLSLVSDTMGKIERSLATADPLNAVTRLSLCKKLPYPARSVIPAILFDPSRVLLAHGNEYTPEGYEGLAGS